MAWFTIYLQHHPDEDFVSADDLEAPNAREALAEAKSMYPHTLGVEVMPEEGHLRRAAAEGEEILRRRRNIFGSTSEEERSVLRDIFS